MLRFVLLILSLLHVALCFAEFSHRLMYALFDRIKRWLFLRAVARFRKS
jgi:hypothetical protein